MAPGRKAGVGGDRAGARRSRAWPRTSRASASRARIRRLPPAPPARAARGHPARPRRPGAGETLDRSRARASCGTIAPARARSSPRDGCARPGGDERPPPISGRPWSASRPSISRSRLLGRSSSWPGRSPESPGRGARRGASRARMFERLARSATPTRRPACYADSESRRAWPERYGALTKRETEVLSLLAAGCTNAQIGERWSSAGGPRSTTSPASCPSWACAAAPRRPPTRYANRLKIGSRIGIPTDAAGTARRHPLSGSSPTTR